MSGKSIQAVTGRMWHGRTRIARSFNANLKNRSGLLFQDSSLDFGSDQGIDILAKNVLHLAFAGSCLFAAISLRVWYNLSFPFISLIMSIGQVISNEHLGNKDTYCSCSKLATWDGNRCRFAATLSLLCEKGQMALRWVRLGWRSTEFKEDRVLITEYI